MDEVKLATTRPRVDKTVKISCGDCGSTNQDTYFICGLYYPCCPSCQTTYLDTAARQLYRSIFISRLLQKEIYRFTKSLQAQKERKIISIILVQSIVTMNCLRSYNFEILKNVCHLAHTRRRNIIFLINSQLEEGRLRAYQKREDLSFPARPPEVSTNIYKSSYRRQYRAEHTLDHFSLIGRGQGCLLSYISRKQQREEATGCRWGHHAVRLPTQLMRAQYAWRGCLIICLNTCERPRSRSHLFYEIL